MNAWTLSATELLAGYANGSLSPVEAMRSTLERAAAINPKLNAFFEIRGDEAMAQARAAEERWAKHAPAGPLDGVPVSIKDSVAATGWPYWRGTKARVGTVSSYDAPPTARLKEAGAIIFAKTTMPDYGLLASGISSAHGVTRNPWDLRMNTGGSSSGAAASVAAGAGALSIGSDLGGSVRLPAAQCGLFGHKPTVGLVPHLPVSTARVAGPLTRTVADGALLLSVISRPDARTGEPAGPTPARVEPLAAGGLKLGLLLDMGYGPDVEAEVAQLIEHAARLLEAQGATLATLPAPVDVDLNPVFDQIFSVRAAMERDELPPERSREALDAINRTCEAGDRLSAKAYLRAGETLDKAKASFVEALSPFDFVLAPVLPVTGFAADAAGADPEHPTWHVNFTSLINQIGWPAASICCGFTAAGLPIGLQIIAAKHRDAVILALAATYERLRGFTPGIPEI
ncbi:amidase [Chelatococcus reniformis]|uniref:Indoleacetamide hydrolase n=1 Tax=Chelatococcus reniformis TaxID=1494448 RepID=A0A916XLS4_9HYPH|nr:amidase [Chelatococcus reniformis]GGC85096.1 amidase [Chelatococcus reniformis]